MASRDFSKVTERAGDEITAEQLSRLSHRYGWAGTYCRGKDVLEAACGTGPGLGILSSQARSLRAGDYTQSILAITHEHYKDRVALQRFDAEAMPFADRSMDVVILFEAIYYLPNASRFVAECRRVLRPGGKALIATANKDLYDFNPSPHSHMYPGVVEFHELFGSQGFDVECFGYLSVRSISIRQRVFRPIKAAVVNLGIMPGTAAGKRWLKRIVFGSAIPMPAEVAVDMQGYEPPAPLFEVHQIRSTRLSTAQRACLANRPLPIALNQRRSIVMTVRSVPFFDYPQVFTAQEEGLLSVIRDVGRRGAFIMQRDLVDFEEHLREYTGAPYVLGVGNATDGLHFAVRAAGIGRGDEVIFCSHTMVATAAAIHFAGATPVPVECGADHMIDPEAAREAITARTRAIMPTQLNGRTCDMDALQAIATEHGLSIIEDAAQALGSKYRNQCAGTFGVAGAISFYPAKTLGCLGDAGAVLIQQEEVFERVHMLRDHGRNVAGEVVGWGLNSRLDNMQAAILDYKLASYQEEVNRRREIASIYQDRLGQLPELALPPAPGTEPDHFDVFQNYEIEAERRDELQDYLRAQGIGTLIQWGGKAVHQFDELGLGCSLPAVELMFTRCLMLPMNTFISEDDVEYVCAQVTSFYGS